MGLRFFRRIHIAPGIGLNVSKSGPSLTLGVRGAHVTLGPTAVTKTVGLPGSGIYYTSRSGYHSGMHSGVPHAGGGSGFVLGLIIGVAVVIVIALVVL